MHRTFLFVHRTYAKILLWAAILAGFCAFAIMCVIDANALLRKLINWPVPAALEITQSLLVVSIMLPFAYTLLRREHVNTVFFTSMLSSETRRRLYFFWSVVGFLLFAAVTWGTFEYALRSYRMNEKIWGATIQFAVWPSKMAISFGTLLLTIQFLLEAIGTALIRTFHEPEAHTEIHGDV